MSFRILLFFVVALLPLRAALPADLVSPAYRLTPGENDSSWQPLIAELKAKPPLKATFEEHRYFPFRKGSAKLTGEIRLDPVRGLSLHYQTPEDRLVVMDPRGGFMAEAGGRRRELPDDPRAKAASTALLNVLRFDLPELAKNFEIYGAHEGDVWRFTVIPRPGPLASILNPITVSGDSGLVRVIEMRKSGAQRIVIIISDTVTGVTFDAAELTTYFR